MKIRKYKKCRFLQRSGLLKLTHRGHDLLHSEEGCQAEKVDVLEEVETEEGMLRIESKVELEVDVRI